MESYAAVIRFLGRNRGSPILHVISKWFSLSFWIQLKKWRFYQKQSCGLIIGKTLVHHFLFETCRDTSRDLPLAISWMQLSWSLVIRRRSYPSSLGWNKNRVTKGIKGMLPICMDRHRQLYITRWRTRLKDTSMWSRVISLQGKIVRDARIEAPE